MTMPALPPGTRSGARRGASREGPAVPEERRWKKRARTGAPALAGRFEKTKSYGPPSLPSPRSPSSRARGGARPALLAALRVGPGRSSSKLVGQTVALGEGDGEAVPVPHDHLGLGEGLGRAQAYDADAAAFVEDPPRRGEHGIARRRLEQEPSPEVDVE